MRNNACSNSDGFTIMEVLISIIIFTIALLGFASTSLTVTGGNRASSNVTQASVMAMSQIEAFRNMTIDLGTDGVIGGGDDIIDAQLLNDDDDNDISPDIKSTVTLFTNADNGTGTLSSTPTVAWNVAYNKPVASMITVTVIAGWLETGRNRFVAVSTALQGE